MSSSKVTALKSVQDLVEAECANIPLAREAEQQQQEQPAADGADDVDPAKLRDDAQQLAQLQALVRKWRFRSRDALGTALSAEQHGIKMSRRTAKSPPADLDPARVSVEVSLAPQSTHQALRARVDNRTGQHAVGHKHTEKGGRWWRCAPPFGRDQVQRIADRAAMRGLHSLVVVQSAPDLTHRVSGERGAFLDAAVRILRGLTAKVGANAIRIRVIAVKRPARGMPQLIAMVALPDEEGGAEAEWAPFDGARCNNAVPMLVAARSHTNADDDDLAAENTAAAMCRAIGDKARQMLLEAGPDDGRTTCISSPGRLAGPNGRPTYVRTDVERGSWVVQFVVVTEQVENRAVAQAKARSAQARAELAAARGQEARLYYKTQVRLPNRMRKLAGKAKKAERDRLKAMKKKQMKTAFSMIDRKKKAEAELEDTTQELARLERALVAARSDADTKTTVNGDVAEASAAIENNLPHSSVGVVTLVGLLGSHDAFDATILRECLEKASVRAVHGDAIAKDYAARAADSLIVRKLLQLHLPFRKTEGVSGPAFDGRPLPEVERLRTGAVPRIAYATRWLGLWCHCVVEVDRDVADPVGAWDAWHAVMLRGKRRHAAWVLQNWVRCCLAYRRRKRLAAAREARMQTSAARAVQTAYRRILAMKRVARRKREILAEELRAKREAEKEKQRVVREKQRRKKREAMEAAKKRRDEKAAIEAAERKRRGW